MKKVIIMLAAMIALSASAQSNPAPSTLPHNVLSPQDSTFLFDQSAYQAHNDFSYHLDKAGKHIVTSIVLEGVGLASSVIGLQEKSTQVSEMFYLAGAGFAITGVVFLFSAGRELQVAAESHRRIHPIPYGVSIKLN